MAELGIGLAGCGRWGQRLAKTIGQLEGGRIVAVQDWNLAAAQAVGAALNTPVHATYQELIADPAVEALLVVTPHALHEEVTVAAAQAGKHVFCEKPLAVDLAASYRMIDATEQHGVKLMCGQVTRLYPIYQRVAEIAHSGRLGRLAAMNVLNLVHIDRVSWWAKSAMMGALLHSPGVHLIDFLLHVCGSAVSVYAVESGVRVQPGVDYQDSLFLLIEFAGGVIGGLECSVSCLTPSSQGHLIGSLGSLSYDPQASRIDFASWRGEQERIEIGPGDNEARMEIGIRAELQSFIDWVTRDAAPLLTAWDGLRAVAIIEAAYQSIACKQPIALSELRPTPTVP
jgi:predicted dehydrogenase